MGRDKSHVNHYTLCSHQLLNHCSILPNCCYSPVPYAQKLSCTGVPGCNIVWNQSLRCERHASCSARWHCNWHVIWSHNHRKVSMHMGACGPVDRALDARSGGLGFDSQCWPCVEVSGKLRIPHCLGPPSRNGYLVHRSKVGLNIFYSWQNMTKDWAEQKSYV